MWGWGKYGWANLNVDSEEGGEGGRGVLRERDKKKEAKIRFQRHTDTVLVVLN
jgi:hypothetical protein